MIQFVKAHAYGNDFLIVDSKMAEREGHRELAIRLCARNTGLGADGVEYLEWIDEHAGRIHLYNADGSMAEISGNGTRCVAAWMAYQTQTRDGGRIVIETDAGRRENTIIRTEGNRFEVACEMGEPKFAVRALTLGDDVILKGAVVSTGNPHYVIFADDDKFTVAGRNWVQTGRAVCEHPAFPQQTNVEFVRVLNRSEIEIRIFERGVGPTSSSGSGTCASAVAAIMLQGADHDLLVRAPGGVQRVQWTGPGQQIVLTGVAELVATGDIFPRQRAGKSLGGMLGTIGSMARGSASAGGNGSGDRSASAAGAGGAAS
ncbi:MAG TPA: diaminopimelate epimerase [Acidisarcina sp.]